MYCGTTNGRSDIVEHNLAFEAQASSHFTT
jgi:hypothetical protein